MNYKIAASSYGYRMAFVCLMALAAVAAWTPDAAAYNDYSGCAVCHGDFRASNYVSLMDGQSWGNLHDVHRTSMLSSDCSACHSGTSRLPVYINVSTGGNGLQPLSCVGCHGRAEDAGHDSGSPGYGAGLRQHHARAGVLDCQDCHTDSNPATYTPVKENVKPPYYANPGTNHPNMPTDPCNRRPTAVGKETFAGLLLGLDNDGNDLYDTADPACRSASSRINFDGDGMTDFVVWRPGTTSSTWYVKRSSDNVVAAPSWGSGSQNDVPVPGDYDGDGKTDLAVWRPGTANATWYIKRSSDNAVVAPSWGSGSQNDVPVPGDYDGDGKTDLAVWRPGTTSASWFIKQSSDNAVVASSWGSGSQNDVPVPGDYDGDGKTDLAVWRPGEGRWYIKQSSDNAVVAPSWGSLNDVPVPGDYDGDGKTDLAVWRPADAMWYIKRSSDGVVVATSWGSLNDVPVPGDFDGDGKTDLVVWRAGNGTWYVKQSSNGAVVATSWGSTGDVPLKAKY